MRPASVRSLRAAVSCAAVATAVLVAGCGAQQTGFVSRSGTAPMAKTGAKFIEPAKREQAPEVSGTTLEGKHLSLDSYEGKVVILNFWASWCGPCREEIPVLQDIYHKYRDRGVRLVGVNTKDSKANAKAFVRTFDIEYPSFYDQPGRIALAFRETVPPSALPSTIIIDRKGRVAARVIGQVERKQLARLVRRVAGG